jgi:succinate-semialdehyde dehydrogenase/glutarate-semialdehyde dehydrogenase
MSAPNPRGLREIASINPATGELLRQFDPHSPEEVERRLKLAVSCFREYHKSTFILRAQWLNQAARILESDKAGLARTMTLEMGKPIRAAVQEVEKCAAACRYFAENGARFLEPEPGSVKEARSYTRYDPLGPILAVMPWNFPLWQVFRFAAPALMAGNIGLLKHASQRAHSKRC